MKDRETQSQQGPTRRRFLRAAGLGTAASLTAAARFLAPTPVTAEEPRPQPQPEPPPRHTLTLGMASYSLREFSLDEALAMTRRLDLEYICLKSFHLPLESTPEQIAEAVDKVKQSGIKLYGGGVITMNDQAQVEGAFDYAKAAGMTTIVGSPHPRVLPLVEEKVRQYDIRLAIHNHGPDERTYPTPQSAYEQIEQLDKRIGLCIDVGHTVRAGADPVAAAEKYADRLLDVHLKDVTAATRRGSTIEAGRGVIDLPRLLRTLVEIEYSCVASFEFEKDARDPLPGLAESVGYVRGILAAQGRTST